MQRRLDKLTKSVKDLTEEVNVKKDSIDASELNVTIMHGDVTAIYDDIRSLEIGTLGELVDRVEHMAGGSRLYTFTAAEGQRTFGPVEILTDPLVFVDGISVTNFTVAPDGKSITFSYGLGVLNSVLVYSPSAIGEQLASATEILEAAASIRGMAASATQHVYSASAGQTVFGPMNLYTRPLVFVEGVAVDNFTINTELTHITMPFGLDSGDRVFVNIPGGSGAQLLVVDQIQDMYEEVILIHDEIATMAGGVEQYTFTATDGQTVFGPMNVVTKPLVFVEGSAVDGVTVNREGTHITLPFGLHEGDTVFVSINGGVAEQLSSVNEILSARDEVVELTELISEVSGKVETYHFIASAGQRTFGPLDVYTTPLVFVEGVYINDIEISESRKEFTIPFAAKSGDVVNAVVTTGLASQLASVDEILVARDEVVSRTDRVIELAGGTIEYTFTATAGQTTFGPMNLPTKPLVFVNGIAVAGATVNQARTHVTIPTPAQAGNTILVNAPGGVGDQIASVTEIMAARDEVVQIRDDVSGMTPYMVKDAVSFMSLPSLVNHVRYLSKDGMAWDVVPRGTGQFNHPSAQAHAINLVAANGAVNSMSTPFPGEAVHVSINRAMGLAASMGVGVIHSTSVELAQQIIVPNGVKFVKGEGGSFKFTSAYAQIATGSIFGGQTENVTGCAITDLLIDMNGFNTEAIVCNNAVSVRVDDNTIINGGNATPIVFRSHGEGERASSNNTARNNNISLAPGSTSATNSGIAVDVPVSDFNISPFATLDAYIADRGDHPPVPFGHMNMIVEGNTINGGNAGIRMVASSRGRVAGNSLSNGVCGIDLSHMSENNMCEGNIIIDNRSSAYRLYAFSKGNIIHGGKVSTSVAALEAILDVTVGSTDNSFHDIDVSTRIVTPKYHVYIGPGCSGTLHRGHVLSGDVSKAHIAIETAWNSGEATNPAGYAYGNSNIFYDTSIGNTDSVSIDDIVIRPSGASPKIGLYIAQHTGLGGAVRRLTNARIVGNQWIAQERFTSLLTTREMSSGAIEPIVFNDNIFPVATDAKFAISNGQAQFLTTNGCVEFGVGREVTRTSGGNVSLGTGMTIIMEPTSAVTVDNFTGAPAKGELIVVAANANTTIRHNSSAIRLVSDRSVVMPRDGVLVLFRRAGVWIEKSRSW